jgi:four helix bundle protein
MKGNEKLKRDRMSEEVNDKKIDILERCIKYSLDIIELCNHLEKSSAGKTIGRQLLRSGLSVGANIHEAQGGQSKADFIAKVSIAHKEARESAYWLRIIHDARIARSQEEVKGLQGETEQLIRILSSILLTSKQNVKRAL